LLSAELLAVVTQIAKAITEVREKTKSLHLFIDLREFEKNGWDAVANNERPERVDTLRGIMRRTEGPDASCAGSAGWVLSSKKKGKARERVKISRKTSHRQTSSF
jgi:hypothetical protein